MSININFSLFYRYERRSALSFPRFTREYKEKSRKDEMIEKKANEKKKRQQLYGPNTENSWKSPSHVAKLFANRKLFSGCRFSLDDVSTFQFHSLILLLCWTISMSKAHGLFTLAHVWLNSPPHFLSNLHFNSTISRLCLRLIWLNGV